MLLVSGEFDYLIQTIQWELMLLYRVLINSNVGILDWDSSKVGLILAIQHTDQ